MVVVLSGASGNLVVTVGESILSDTGCGGGGSSARNLPTWVCPVKSRMMLSTLTKSMVFMDSPLLKLSFSFMTTSNFTACGMIPARYSMRSDVIVCGYSLIPVDRKVWRCVERVGRRSDSESAKRIEWWAVQGKVVGESADGCW